MTVRCALCFIDGQLLNSPGHVHFHGDVPLTPCPLCLTHKHDLCDPIRFFCTCSCGLREEPR